MLWFAVYFPRLGLEIVERRHYRPCRHPDETAPPTVLVEDGRVRLANAPARKVGIVPGATLATAHGIASRLRHFERDPATEVNQLHHLAEAVYRYTSHVSVCAPNGLVLDMQGSQVLFGGVEALAGEIERLCSRMGHAARVAFAHTPAGALTLARAGRRPSPEALMPAAALDALRGVPLACAEIEARDVERLANMGVFQIGQLLALPRDELGTRFGPGLQSYLARLVGELPDPRTPIVPREIFTSSLHLIEAIANKQTLLFPMRRLTTELATWLAARQLGVLRLSWAFHPLHGASCRIETRFAHPRGDALGMLDIAKLRLEQADLPAETMGIELTAMETAPCASEAEGLFGAADFAAPLASTDEGRTPAPAPMHLVDAIAARLGNRALQCLALTDDHRPERAWTPRRPSAKHIADARKSAPAPGIGESRPLWLFDPPRPVRARRFRFLAGPERIEAGWWDTAVARDYYVAIDGDGTQCWLFQARDHRSGDNNPSDEGWFLHGYFA